MVDQRIFLYSWSVTCYIPRTYYCAQLVTWLLEASYLFHKPLWYWSDYPNSPNHPRAGRIVQGSFLISVMTRCRYDCRRSDLFRYCFAEKLGVNSGKCLRNHGKGKTLGQIFWCWFAPRFFTHTCNHVLSHSTTCMLNCTVHCTPIPFSGKHILSSFLRSQLF